MIDLLYWTILNSNNPFKYKNKGFIALHQYMNIGIIDVLKLDNIDKFKYILDSKRCHRLFCKWINNLNKIHIIDPESVYLLCNVNNYEIVNILINNLKYKEYLGLIFIQSIIINNFKLFREILYLCKNYSNYRDNLPLRIISIYGRIDMFVRQFYQVAVVRKKYHLSLM